MSFKKVHKFGGSSLGSSERIRNVLSCLELKPKTKSVIVVSAFGKVTDLLEEALFSAQENKVYKPILDQLLKIHTQVINELCPDEKELLHSIEDDVKNLDLFLKVSNTLSYSSKPLYSFVVGHGELWSGRIFNSVLNSNCYSSQFLNARDFLIIEESMDTLEVNWESSKQKLKNCIEFTSTDYLVVTGFVAKTSAEVPTTLGRNGSDYSAAIIANLIEANSLCIWTDVDGIYTCDPRIVPDARRISKLTYSEAIQIAQLGSKVVHPNTMKVLRDKGIPIEIRSSLDVNSKGTQITTQYEVQQEVSGISLQKNVVKVTFFLKRKFKLELLIANVFGACRRYQISILAMKTGPENQKLDLLLKDSEWNLLSKELKGNLIIHDSINKFEVRENLCLLSLVNHNYANRSEAISKFLKEKSMDERNVESFNSDEHHTSLLIDNVYSQKFTNALHKKLADKPKEIAIGLLGPGNVGSHLIRDINKLKSDFSRIYGYRLSIVAISNSKTQLYGENLDLGQWEERGKTQTYDYNINQLIKTLHQQDSEFKILFDCTASKSIGSVYGEVLSKGITLITANKNPLVQKDVNYIKEYYGSNKLFYEATVGAALPILSTICNMRNSSDHIESIEGVFSGSLSYIFNSIFGKAQMKFSGAIKAAMEKGMTEPDPREDLSGFDVARKVLILARSLGYECDLDEISIEPLLTPHLESMSKDEFLNSMTQIDKKFEQLISSTRKEDNILSFVGKFDRKNGLRCTIEKNPSNHIYGQLKGPENVFTIRSRGYNSHPLVIKGPGAGPQVTSQALISDLFRWSQINLKSGEISSEGKLSKQVACKRLKAA